MQDIIQAFKVEFERSEIDSFLASAKEIVSSGKLIPGQYNERLEELFASFTGSKFATTVSSGTVALEVIFRGLNLQKKEILIPCNTNYATAEAAIRAEADVKLYDSGLYPDFESIKQSASKKTGALVIVHIGGYITPEIEKIKQYCRDNNILLIEDASHAHGSQLNGKAAGTFGIAGAFSMFATKVITTSEGGIITTGNKKLWLLGKTYRDQGKDKEGTRNIVRGSSWRMSELHASLGVAQMNNARGYVTHNNAIAHRYKKELHASDQLHIPLEPDAIYSGYKFIVMLKNQEKRDSLSRHLISENIKPGKGVYDVPLHLQPALSHLNIGAYPQAEEFSKTHLCLPIWKHLTDDAVNKVIGSVNRWVGNEGRS